MDTLSPRKRSLAPDTGGPPEYGVCGGQGVKRLAFFSRISRPPGQVGKDPADVKNRVNSRTSRRDDLGGSPPFPTPTDSEPALGAESPGPGQQPHNGRVPTGL